MLLDEVEGIWKESHVAYLKSYVAKFLRELRKATQRSVNSLCR
jgi:hypothetical protein